jgi:hypothetical protein
MTTRPLLELTHFLGGAGRVRGVAHFRIRQRVAIKSRLAPAIHWAGIMRSVMRRDHTVWISFALLISGLALVIALPDAVEKEGSPVRRTAIACLLVGGVRGWILWLQTLIHGTKHARPENRVAVVLGHVLLGPLMAFAHYFAARRNLGRSRPPASPFEAKTLR